MEFLARVVERSEWRDGKEKRCEVEMGLWRGVEKKKGQGVGEEVWRREEI
jgi:hypothetical protein